MLAFYKKAYALFGLLLIISLLLGYLCRERVFLHRELLPADNSEMPWQPVPESDLQAGGDSTITLNDASFSLNFTATVREKLDYPYASLSLFFVDAATGEPALLDLSRYSRLTFSTRCEPANVLFFSLDTIEEGVTQPGDQVSYRAPTGYFACEQKWTEVELDLTRLETPQWWLDRYQVKLSKMGYQLDEVRRLTFGITHQSPHNQPLNIQLDALVLQGRDWRYMYALVGILGVLWVGYAFWFFRQHTKTLTEELKQKIRKDRPLVAYQQLSVEPRSDREKSAILRYMATEYANPELNLDMAVTVLGVSRTKINEILKEEIGHTFTTYLNKLRLSEAARLLSLQPDIGVAEIAYTVGYKNVSYFNKLFKNEYGCTPKTFRQLSESE